MNPAREKELTESAILRKRYRNKYTYIDKLKNNATSSTQGKENNIK